MFGFLRSKMTALGAALLLTTGAAEYGIVQLANHPQVVAGPVQVVPGPVVTKKITVPVKVSPPAGTATVPTPRVVLVAAEQPTPSPTRTSRTMPKPTPTSIPKPSPSPSCSVSVPTLKVCIKLR